MLIKRVELRTILKWALVPIIIGLSVHTARLTNSLLRAKEVRLGGPIPYTVILKETVFHAVHSSVTKGMTMTQAIRPDGSFVSRKEHEDSGDIPKTLVYKERTIKFSSGIMVDINELTDTKSTVAYRVNPAHWQRDPDSKCINSFDGTTQVGAPAEVISGEEAIAGYRTVKIVRNGATRWYALDVGCAMVKERVDWGAQGFSEKNLVVLIPGEPEAALFDVPAKLREVPPSERMPRPGVTPQPHHIEIFREYDKEYYKNRVVN